MGPGYGIRPESLQGLWAGGVLQVGKAEAFVGCLLVCRVFRVVTTFACWEYTPATSFSETPPAGGAEGANAGSDLARF